MKKKIAWVFGICFVFVLLFKFCEFKKNDSASLENATNLIQQQLVNVGKLVVTEGHFAEVLTYKDQDKYLMGLVTFDKKALIIVNADVTVSYDLHQIKYAIDAKNKLIRVLNIPKEEIKISPDIQFYDVEQSSLNPFSGDDYNKINKIVKANMAIKIAKSTLKSNAQNRLLSELSKMLILTSTMGWRLEYRENEIKKAVDFLNFK